MKRSDDDDEEERQLRSVALQNAQSILLARQRAEEELVRAKEALELRTQELARSLAMLRATLESTTDGILVTDGSGQVTGFNEKFVEMWRLPRELMSSRQHQRLLEVTSHYFEDPRRFIARVEELYASSPPESYDLLELADGRVYERFSRIQFVEQQNVGRVWSFRDITRWRKDEERLRQSVTQFQQLADALPQMVWTARSDGFIDYYNERWYEFTGFRRDEFGDPSWIPILHPDDVQRSVDTYAGCIRTGSLFQIEYRFKDRRTGGYRWFLGRAYPVCDNQGRIIRWFGTCTDIDQTKRTEETTRFLADASATLAELTDYQSTLQRVASLAVPAFADWCSVDMQEADGSTHRLAVSHADPLKGQLARELFLHHPPRPADSHGVMKVMRSGESEWQMTISDSYLQEMAHDEGHLSLLQQLGPKSYICTPLRSRSKTLGTLTFLTAESGRAYEARDLAAAEDLAHRAVIAIENASLLAALKASDRRKDEFLAILAHELRNPLAPIRNSVYILRAKAPPVQELQWAMDVIERQIHQMTRLVDDLLDVSRITRDTIQLQKESIDLASVVNSAVEASRPVIEKYGHNLTITVPPVPIYLDADLTRLSQVLLNLLNNAAKYTDPGGQIWLSLQQEGGDVLIRVKDTGIGIPAEMLPHIFEMFTQVDRSLDRAQGGLGIGLTLVQRLVEMHGGDVKAYSEGPGKGSELVVRLPIVHAAAGRKLRDPAHDVEAHAPPPPRRVLVVDDNRDAADSLGMLLQMLGNEVRLAHDGLEAVAVASAFQPDLVLLDIGLPKMNGYDTARRIRSERGNTVLLVAVTGWGQAEDRRRSKEAGFDIHLTKPIDLDALHELLAAPGSSPSERGRTMT